MTLGKDLLGDLVKKIDEQDDPKQVYLDKIKEKQRRLDEGEVPAEKRPI